jgi:hypothetical protein
MTQAPPAWATFTGREVTNEGKPCLRIPGLLPLGESLPGPNRFGRRAIPSLVSSTRSEWKCVYPIFRTFARK